MGGRHGSASQSEHQVAFLREGSLWQHGMWPSSATVAVRGLLEEGSVSGMRYGIEALLGRLLTGECDPVFVHAPEGCVMNGPKPFKCLACEGEEFRQEVGHIRSKFEWDKFEFHLIICKRCGHTSLISTDRATSFWSFG